ncbi:conserved membrane protein of unknown function [Candidatus Hydrogenisulfobacillus filiaventi]|uniref:FxsA family protein n=1 Tax=Candidatus Hydrogenisulfobacillus filiaventi TaxID=2707344 RepID=A0A6F8ZDJ2_9FIRM|nr:FxsA family protein [Bacillota bacterium]CAB1128001.1 conserved membrane protein of unknown function [Candidatus Hydrogenisulfobacillus filiaventi]
MAAIWLLLGAVPVVELAATLLLARWAGWPFTLLWTAGSTAVGIGFGWWGTRHWLRTVRAEWRAEGFPIHRLGEGLVAALALLLVVTPGPLTGVAGLVLSVPAVRSRAGARLARWAGRRLAARLWPPRL